MKRKMKTSEVLKKAEKLRDPSARDLHERTQRLLAERIAYHEQKLREERELRGE